MANPYHDENGKFCSRDEMLTRIDALRDAGKSAAQFELRDQLYAADAKVSARFGKRKQAAEKAKEERSKIEGPIRWHQSAAFASPTLVENIRRVLDAPVDPAQPHRAFHAIKELIYTDHKRHPAGAVYDGIGDIARPAAMILDNFNRSEEVDWPRFQNLFKTSALAGYELVTQN